MRAEVMKRELEENDEGNENENVSIQARFTSCL